MNGNWYGNGQKREVITISLISPNQRNNYI